MSSGSAVLRLGHRGARRECTENTLPSLQRALDLGADGVECDLRMTGDGQVVLFHDPDLRRLLGRPDRLDQTVWSELRRLPLRGGGRVALLEDLLAVWPTEAWLNLELKSGGREMVARTLALVSARPRTFLSSFDPGLLRFADSAGWQGERWLILGLRSAPHLFSHGAASLGCQGVVLQAPLCAPKSVVHRRQAGLGVATWGARNRAHERRLVAVGVGRVITDDPRAVL
ncbi:MAG: glycerophosphodiester phosphodiesterase [Nannocystaceae bacterium]